MKKKNAGQKRYEIHLAIASSGAKKPRTNKRGRTTSEVHLGAASSSPASWRMKSNEALRGTDKRSLRKHETHIPNTPHGPAMTVVNPIPGLPDHNSADQYSRDLHATPVSSADVHTKFESHDINGVGTSLIDNQSFIENHSSDVVDADAHASSETQATNSIGNPSSGHLMRDTHARHAAGDDRTASDSQSSSVISKISELWKNRQAWHRAEKSLTLQGKAQCRRFTEGDKDKANKLFAELEGMVDGQSCGETHGIVASAILPFIEARASLINHRKLIEKELIKMAKVLPVYPWAEEIRGFGPLSLAAIVGCAGDLSNYSTVSKLWKRMGLAVIGGKRQRRVRDAIEAREHGFSPERAAVMFNIGGALIGGMGHGPRPRVGEDISTRDDLSSYQKRFIELIRKEVERVTDTWNGPEHKREPVEKKGELYESYSSHAAARIRRRIAKEFLRDLWVAQRGLNKRCMEPKPAILGPTLTMEAAE